MRSVYLSNRFFWAMGAIAALFALSFGVPVLYPVAQILLVLLGVLVAVELFLLFRKKTILTGERKMANILSMNDPNKIDLTIRNVTKGKFNLEVIDELPPQLETRDFSFKTTIAPFQTIVHQYKITPLSRGKYHFGHTNCFLSTLTHLIQRRVRVAAPEFAPVFPSIIHMKEMELKTLSDLAHDFGIKKIRRIGHSYEFEQIKQYQQGDDIRSINWKASSRHHQLMVNQYEDERSQQIYMVIDKSRVMRMPFEGLTLMDYAINSTLALSNIILKKHDKPGLITFSDKLGSLVPAEQRSGQLQKIMYALYGEKERKGEANYELVHFATRQLINHRSMILLFTNFESIYALKRALPVLRRVNKNHLLIVVLFINTEIEAFAKKDPKTDADIYNQVIAEKFLYEKKQMQHLLRQQGIQTIYTRPQDLSVNTINKYLELKAKGLI